MRFVVLLLEISSKDFIPNKGATISGHGSQNTREESLKHSFRSQFSIGLLNTIHSVLIHRLREIISLHSCLNNIEGETESPHSDTRSRTSQENLKVACVLERLSFSQQEVQEDSVSWEVGSEGYQVSEEGGSSTSIEALNTIICDEFLNAIDRTGVNGVCGGLGLHSYPGMFTWNTDDWVGCSSSHSAKGQLRNSENIRTSVSAKKLFGAFIDTKLDGDTSSNGDEGWECSLPESFDSTLFLIDVTDNFR